MDDNSVNVDQREEKKKALSIVVKHIKNKFKTSWCWRLLIIVIKSKSHLIIKLLLSYLF